MSILSEILGTVLKPLQGLVDDLHLSGEEKLEAQRRIMELQSALAAKMLDYESVLATQQGESVRAEAAGHSWLQRNWRPLTMLLFAYIVAHNYVVSPIFGVPSVPIPPDMWDLLKIGIGGYVLGRSAEKIVPSVVEGLRNGR